MNIQETFDRKWILAEEIMNANPWFMAICFYCFTNQFREPSGKAYDHLVSIYKGYHLWFYFDEKSAKEVADHIVQRFVEDVSFMEEVNKQIREFAVKLKNVVRDIPESGLEELSKEQLWEYYINHEKLHHEYYQWGWIPVAADMFGDQLTNKGKEVLLELGVSPNSVNEYLTALTHPAEDSVIKQEHDDLIEIALLVQKVGWAPSVRQRIKDHHHKYFYTKFIYTEEQGVYSEQDYMDAVDELAKNANLEEGYRQQDENTKEALYQKGRILKELRLEDKWVRFFTAWGDFMVTKIIRRDAQLFALYKTTFYLQEISKRIGVSLKELRFMKTSEIKQALFDGVIDKDEVAKRVDYSLYYTSKDTEIYFSGEQAKEIVDKYIKTDDLNEVDQLKGQCACRGVARGVVKIVNVITDMAKMNEGDILVSISTQPDLVPAMKKASAFVTDQGGVTSHAAIVAREMNTPCVIGTKIATQALRDGDEVEVDADQGVVRIIKKNN